MADRFSRAELLYGSENMEKLRKARVCVFGVGGVGGYVVEALARSGVGHLTIVDNDVESLTNINRQIIALERTVGLSKVDVMKERILDINPEADVDARRTFYLPETAGEFDFSTYDYIVDAVDTVTAKLEIIMRAKETGTPVISCMGAGNKKDPSRFRIVDIYKTSVDPLSKVMRRELKARGVKHLKVVFSDEIPTKPVAAENSGTESTAVGEELPQGKRSIPGSTAFAPAAAGLVCAAEIVKDLTE